MCFFAAKRGERRGWGEKQGDRGAEAKELGFLGLTKPKFKSSDTNFTRHGVNVRCPKKEEGEGGDAG